MADPWKHRSESMKCKTCMWFVIKATDSMENPVLPLPELGRCRRHSPTMNGYPAVFTHDWCGDHKLDENKVLFTPQGGDPLVKTAPILGP
jgi:hypothetical protein